MADRKPDRANNLQMPGSYLRGLVFARTGPNIDAVWSRLRSPHRGPRPHAEHHSIPGWFWFVLAVIATLQMAVIFDEASVAWATDLPDWVRDFFETLTHLGLADWILYPAGAALLVFFFADWRGGDRLLRAAWAEMAALVGYVFVAIGGAGLVTNMLKPIIGRNRPKGFDENGWLSFDAFNFDYDYASFPSGHSTTAGAAMIAAALIFPRFRLPIIAIGCLVAFSRVVIGAHFPSDAVAGLAIGSAFAYVTARWLLRRRVGFVVGQGGHIRPRLRAWRRAATDLGLGRLLTAPALALAGMLRPRAREAA